MSLSLSPLLSAPFAIRIHVAAAIAAFLLGLVQFAGRKGHTTHRVLGWTWVALMVVVAASSVFIVDFRNLRPTALILFLSVFVLIQLPLAVMAARRGNLRAHKMTMIGLYVGALVIAGLFTFLPGRLMHTVLFG